MLHPTKHAAMLAENMQKHGATRTALTPGGKVEGVLNLIIAYFDTLPIKRQHLSTDSIYQRL